MKKKSESSLSAGRPSARTSKSTTLARFIDVGPTKRINFDVSIEEHRRLKIYAAQEGKTVRELMTEYVRGLPK
jgi:hypothetical protein